MSIRLPNNVIAFAKDNIKPYEQFVDYFNHFYKKGTYDESVSLSEKEDKLNTAVRSELLDFLIFLLLMVLHLKFWQHILLMHGLLLQ